MGKKLDALLGRSFKASRFKSTLNLAISRLSILKNHRQARCSVARSDVVQLLNLVHHDRALLRVEQVIKEQNMLDAFALIEGYCLLLIERLKLMEQENACAHELKEAAASLLYAATRCGEFPELQEIRAVLISRFGKEFAGRAIELRNNCGVNPKMIQKLSTRQPNLESRVKVLKEIASQNGIVLQIEEPSNLENLDVDQKQNQSKSDPPVNSRGAELEDDSPISPEDIEKVEGFSGSMKGRQKYRDVTDAAQAAFESAAFAAAAARAAVELSRSESLDPDDPNSPNSQSRNRSDTHEHMKCKLQSEDKYSREMEDLNVGLGFEKIHPIQNYHSESEDEEIRIENKAEGSKHNKNAAEFKRSISSSSSDSADNILKETTLSSEVDGLNKPLGKGIVFDDSDDETGNEQRGIPWSRKHDLGFDMKCSLHTNEVLSFAKSNTFKDEDISEGSGAKINSSHKQFPLRSQPEVEAVSGPGDPISRSAQRSRIQGAQRLNTENRPISVRTRRVYGP